MYRHERFESVYKAGMIYSVALIAMGFMLASPAEILKGLYTIITTQDLLITDYFYTAGPGAALVNAGIVTMMAINVVHFSGDPYNGVTIVELGLMSGFALFGKNFVNIWPIIFGTWLYAKNQREPFSKYASVSLMATALAPMVSYAALGSARASLPLGLLVGVIIGFVLPSLSAYTYKVQNGMNLYNMGFACGLFALMVVPIMAGFEDKPSTVLYWAEGYNLLFGCILIGFSALLIVLGLFAYKNPSWAVWAGYRRLLSTTGRAPSDYLRMFGGGPVMVNMGINGIIATTYILLVGDLNGPTIGGILTVMGFAAMGKHARNITPIMAGIALGGLLMNSPSDPALQIAALFGTALAPVAGHFGWMFGVLAGFIHSALVLQTGGPVAGMNLYNNGFSAGLIVVVLYPTITAIVKHRPLHLRDEDYYDLFEETAPIDVSKWRTHEKDNPDTVEEKERIHHHEYNHVPHPDRDYHHRGGKPEHKETESKDK